MNINSNLNSKSIKKFIYQDKNNCIEFYKQKKEFENILTCHITDEIFETLYFNSKVCPSINILKKSNSSFIQDLFLGSKGHLPVACKYLYKKNSTNYNDFQDQEMLQISNHLNEKGYYVKENFYNNIDIENIKKELFKLNYFSVKNIYNQKILNVIKKENPSDSVFGSNLTGNLIKQNTFLHRFITSDYIKKVSEYYFETSPIIVGAVAIHTEPKELNKFDDLEKHLSAQYFHYDQAHLKFLKFFLYLNHIQQSSDGSHCFVEGSHENKLKFPQEEKYFQKSSLRRLKNGMLTGNVTDEWIKKNYADNKVVDFCYPAGTLIVENTTGFHKGNNCTTNPRDIISIIVSLSSLSANDNSRIPEIEIKNTNQSSCDKIYFDLIDTSKRSFNNKVYNNFNKLTFLEIIKKIQKKVLNKIKKLFKIIK
jgi:hypothetical protein